MTCFRRKSTVWPGKLISSKKSPTNSLFLRQNMGITSLWEDLEAKLLKPGQLFGYPWLLWGITVGKVGGIKIKSKAVGQRIFFATGIGNSWKTECFYSSAFELDSATRKRREILWWAIKGEKPVKYRGKNAFLAKSGCGLFLTMFCLAEVERWR